VIPYIHLLLTNHKLILRAFAKLRKAIISFVMSDYPSVCMEQLDSHWTDLHEFHA